MSKITKTATIPATKATSQAVTSSVKDSGRVRIGGGMIRFQAPASVKDSGRVRIGGGMIRF